MNNDRLKFRTPYYLGDKFAGFQYWEFEHGRVKLIVEYWESWVSKRDELTAKPDEQCIGLSDKNGKPIYENDIVKCDRDFRPDGRVGLIRQVVWEASAFMLSANGDSYYLGVFHNIEIIGNVHQHAEQKEQN